MPSTDMQVDLLKATRIRPQLVISFTCYNSIVSGSVLFALGSNGHKLVVIGSWILHCVRPCLGLSKPFPSSEFKDSATDRVVLDGAA